MSARGERHLSVEEEEEETPGPLRLTVPLGTTIREGRVTLRVLRASDVRAMRAFLVDNHEHLSPWLQRPRPGEVPTSLVDVAKKIAGQRKEWREGRGFALGIFVEDREGKRRTSRLIGRVNLNNVVRGAFQNAYLGYMIAKSHEGRGLAREAVSAACEFGFRTLRLHRVQAAIIPHNQRSVALIRALGFREEGRAQGYLMIDGAWRDHLIYAITRDEWRSTARA